VQEEQERVFREAEAKSVPPLKLHFA
jgi:hypothetical protein